MATRQFKAFTEKGTHEVGNLNSLNISTITNGAVVKGDIDNFTLVELKYNAEGVRTAEQLSSKTVEGFLIAPPERRYMGEELVDFYNTTGEHARIVILEPRKTRFDTSAFAKNEGVTTITVGQVAHFDVATKKFIISNKASAHADYATSYNKFEVVGAEDDLIYGLGKPTVRLEVTK